MRDGERTRCSAGTAETIWVKIRDNEGGNVILNCRSRPSGQLDSKLGAVCGAEWPPPGLQVPRRQSCSVATCPPQGLLSIQGRPFQWARSWLPKLSRCPQQDRDGAGRGCSPGRRAPAGRVGPAAAAPDSACSPCSCTARLPKERPPDTRVAFLQGSLPGPAAPGHPGGRKLSVGPKGPLVTGELAGRL